MNRVPRGKQLSVGENVLYLIEGVLAWRRGFREMEGGGDCRLPQAGREEDCRYGGVVD